MDYLKRFDRCANAGRSQHQQPRSSCCMLQNENMQRSYAVRMRCREAERNRIAFSVAHTSQTNELPRTEGMTGARERERMDELFLLRFGCVCARLGGDLTKLLCSFAALPHGSVRRNVCCTDNASLPTVGYTYCHRCVAHIVHYYSMPRSFTTVRAIHICLEGRDNDTNPIGVSMRTQNKINFLNLALMQRWNVFHFDTFNEIPFQSCAPVSPVKCRIFFSADIFFLLLILYVERVWKPKIQNNRTVTCLSFHIVICNEKRSRKKRWTKKVK